MDNLNKEEVRLLIYILDSHQDCGPDGFGWQSEELISLTEKIKAICFDNYCNKAPN